MFLLDSMLFYSIQNHTQADTAATPPQNESRANALLGLTTWLMTYGTRTESTTNEGNRFSHNSAEGKVSLSLQQRERGDAHSLFDQPLVLLNPGS